MPLGLVAIRPKRFDVLNVDRAAVEKAHRTYLLTVGGEMAGYPAQRQGARYRRTGNYGRGWTAPGAVRVSLAEATLVNRVPYAVYVGGPWPQSGHNVGERQTRDMHGRGWTSISAVARKHIKAYEQLINRAIAGRPG